MSIIAMMSQKGGAGKTTIAFNLAVAASTNKATLLLDTDPQISLMNYYDRRLEAGGNELPEVRSIQALRIQQEIKKGRRDGYELIIIDTSPRISQEAVDIGGIADYILIPSTPSAIDLTAIGATAEIAKRSQKPCAAVLNSCKARSQLPKQAETFIEGQLEIQVSPIKIGDRADFVHAASIGLSVLELNPSGKAANEVLELWNWIDHELKGESNG